MHGAVAHLVAVQLSAAPLCMAVFADMVRVQLSSEELSELDALRRSVHAAALLAEACADVSGPLIVSTKLQVCLSAAVILKGFHVDARIDVPSICDYRLWLLCGAPA